MITILFLFNFLILLFLGVSWSKTGIINLFIKMIIIVLMLANLLALLQVSKIMPGINFI